MYWNMTVINIILLIELFIFTAAVVYSSNISQFGKFHWSFQMAENN